MSVRRTWDKELYVQKAAARAEKEALKESEELLAEDLENIKKRKLESSSKTEEWNTHADDGAAGPQGSQRAFLKARTTNITEQLHAKAGTTQIVTAQAMEMGVGGGFWCETCSCLLKDSAAYLSHVNGKNHQRALGFSMRVENVGVDAVKDRFNALKQNMATKSNGIGGKMSGKGVGFSTYSKSKNATTTTTALEEHDAKLELEEEEQRERKKAKKEAKMAAKKATAAKLSTDEVEERATVDPDMAAMMGFSGFK
jgi:U4/U6.U5 tri-snRNP component SNU23